MGLCNYLNIYPDAIERADGIATAALKQNKFSIKEIDDLYDGFEFGCDCEDFANEHVTNTIILQLFSGVKHAIEARCPGKKVDYYVNCYDSHIIIDGEFVG